MKISTVKTETIIINNPSEKLKELLRRAREHKQQHREQIRNLTPLFTIAK